MKRSVKRKSSISISIVMMLAMLIASMPMLMASCGSGGTNEYAEAEAAVSAELDAIKSGGSDLAVVSEFPDEVSDTMLGAYAEKLKDFDYMIAGSEKAEDGESILVTVDITTYDFGSVYLETWNDQMKIEESVRYENQFYNDLFTRFASLKEKRYSGRAEIACVKDENGKWTTDVKTNPALMNAISGGMVAEIEELSEES